MEKLLTEIYAFFKEKISSPFFRYFTISWILWNYKFVYFIFFQNQEVFFKVHEITKFDYLMNNPFFYETWYCNIAFFLIAPLLSTWFMIFVFPIINMYFFKEYDKSTREEDKLKYDYKKFIKNEDIELKKLEVEEKKEEVKVVKEEVKKTKATKEKKTLEVNQFDEWKKEYEEFKKSQAYSMFNQVIEIINFHSWDFQDQYWNYKISKDIVSYLLANKIISKSTQRSDYHLFTEKWEYFAKLYFEENNK